ncbi:hypothetical protein CWB59_12470 [Pseudoalteromonas sp. S326]|uniref:DUF4376 domain-containing protein n=1 Tax=Pseudoalteromonas sp. S326 TaxID=579533 RepID=UPI00110B9D77|nr:DUF4376 domain-containing protein [Pseudoalteromonas sp. S326]TMO16728.1 hypothetical protein CWB59_12470 [Pseudoalteromonas sp. S326]
MLNFINDNDFLLVDKYKQNDGESVSWTYKDGGTLHSGVIRKGMTSTTQVPDGTELVKVGEKLALDNEGNQKLDGYGQSLFEPVYEDQPKYKTETVDIWDKLQTMIAQGNVVVDTSHLLGEAKTTAKGIINSTHDKLNNADIDYNGYTFQAGEQSKSDIMGAVVTGTDTIWLTRDNQEVEMSAEDMRGLGIVIANRKKSLVYKARHFKDALDELNDETEIEFFINNLDWSA